MRLTEEDPIDGTRGHRNLGVEAPALSLLFLFVKIFKPLSSLFSAPTVGMWATRLRCPSEASYPQVRPVRRVRPCRPATRSLVVGCSLIGEAVGSCRSPSIGRCHLSLRGRPHRLSSEPPHILSSATAAR